MSSPDSPLYLCRRKLGVGSEKKKEKTENERIWEHTTGSQSVEIHKAWVSVTLTPSAELVGMSTLLWKYTPNHTPPWALGTVELCLGLENVWASGLTLAGAQNGVLWYSPHSFNRIPARCWIPWGKTEAAFGRLSPLAHTSAFSSICYMAYCTSHPYRFRLELSGYVSVLSRDLGALQPRDWLTASLPFDPTTVCK